MIKPPFSRNAGIFECQGEARAGAGAVDAEPLLEKSAQRRNGTRLCIGGRVQPLDYAIRSRSILEEEGACGVEQSGLRGVVGLQIFEALGFFPFYCIDEGYGEGARHCPGFGCRVLSQFVLEILRIGKIFIFGEYAFDFFGCRTAPWCIVYSARQLSR